MKDNEIAAKDKLSEDFFESIVEMMKVYEQIEEDWSLSEANVKKDFSGIPSKTRVLRKRLLTEEFEEYLVAEDQEDFVEVADALGDILVIAVGTAVAYGIDLPAVLGEIQKSNFAKVNPETGRVEHREDGKTIKPEGWKPPQIPEVM